MIFYEKHSSRVWTNKIVLAPNQHVAVCVEVGRLAFLVASCSCFTVNKAPMVSGRMIFKPIDVNVIGKNRSRSIPMSLRRIISRVHNVLRGDAG